MRTWRANAGVVLGLALLAQLTCSCTSPEEELVEARSTLLRSKDEMYRRYGGSDVARGIETEFKKTGEGAGSSSIGDQLSEIVRNAAKETDRSFFEEACDTLGHGQHPALLTDKARSFFEKPETQEACRRIVTLKDEIARLESALAQPPR